MSSLGDVVEKEHVCASPGLSSHLGLGNQGKITRDRRKGIFVILNNGN